MISREMHISEGYVIFPLCLVKISGMKISGVGKLFLDGLFVDRSIGPNISHENNVVTN
jgi:hypothetical protein